MVTDRDGRFRITAPPGIYGVAAALPREQLRYLSGVLGAEGTPLEEGRLFRIRAGVESAFDYALLPAGALGGQIRSPEGGPVRYASVSVFGVPEDNHGARLLTEGTAATDTEGRFRVAGLAPGVYRVRATPPDQARPDADGRIWLPTSYPNTTTPASALGIAAGLGDQFDGLTVTFIAGTPATVSGRITDIDSPDVAGRMVALVQGNAFRRSLRSMKTDDEGRFIFHDVLPGHYELHVMSRTTAAAWSTALEVADRDVADVTVDVLHTVRLSGRVIFEGERQPPAALTVAALGQELVGSVQARVDADGRFALDVVAPRVLRIDGLPKGWYLKSVVNERDELLDVAFAPELVRGPLTLVVSQRMATVAGTVEGGDDTAAVVLIADDRRRWTPRSSGLVVVEPDAEGRFRVEGLPPGRYRVAAVAHIPGAFYTADPSVLDSLMAGSLSIDFKAGAQSLTFRGRPR